MKQFLQILLLGSLMVVSQMNAADASDKTLVAQGRWGKEVNQLGIKFISPGILPIAPFMCIGGYDVDHDGKVWIADSVNRQIKSFHDRTWRYAMVNCDLLGDMDSFSDKLYVVCKNPDGFLIFDKIKEKVEKLVKVPFKTPGRIVCIRKGLIAIEELAGGVWLIEGEKIFKHPATALEACGRNAEIYGLQKNFDSDTRTIIKAELSKEVQEPEIVTSLDLEPETRLVFSKMAGMVGDKPLVMSISNTSSDVLDFRKIDLTQKTFQKISLPIMDGPYLLTSWKLCSNGELYGFAGNASEGFKIFRSEKNFNP